MFMKVLHVPFTYYPAPCGGTEVYVAALCQALGDRGVECVVAAAAPRRADYVHEGVPVTLFATHPRQSQAMIYGEGDPVAADEFAAVLDRERPDLVHFHAYSAAVGVLALQKARERGIPCVSTYHTPGVSCQRGTLMKWGKTPCDGEMRPWRCAACFLHSHGMPLMLAQMAAGVSTLTAPLARLPGLGNATRAVLNATPLMARRAQATREWWAGMNRVISLCDWTRALLLLNGVPAGRIAQVRHGLPFPSSPVRDNEGPSSLPLRLAFMGRLDATKGIDLLMDALGLVPGLPACLDLFVIAGESERKSLRSACKDSRIRLQAPVPPLEVVPTLGKYDALLVPSRWLETGPLVVLEAFAAGIPVIGSNLGGIAEKVRHEVDGLLVEAPTAIAWKAVLDRLADEPGLLGRLRSGVKPPRTMAEVAEEMHAIYLEETPLHSCTSPPS
ncbi:MAG: glycosyl transferase group 1 [Verrucomicrobiaceae bacterium]|nr:glycosyl transferase group 1 [Verrucomicrobiaceae bacterium]